MSSGNVNQKFFMRSLVLLSLIVIVSISLFSAPILSSIMYSVSNSSTPSFFQLAYAQNGTDSSERDSLESSFSSSTPHLQNLRLQKLPTHPQHHLQQLPTHQQFKNLLP
jgi:hypothetical protein